MAHHHLLKEAAVQERLSTRLQETYVELQQERRVQEDLQAEREESLHAQEALEGEVAGLWAWL